MSGIVAERALTALREAGRPLRSVDFATAGVDRSALSRLARDGVIERVGSGVYRLPEFTSMYADWAALALRLPEAVVCTVSAAAFHGTTQAMPFSIHVALPKGMRPPSSFPVGVDTHYWRATRFAEAFTLGVETHVIDNVPVRITDPERTLVDMFRFSSAFSENAGDRSHVDTETFLDCLRRTISKTDFQIGKLDRYVSATGVGKEFAPFQQTAMYSMFEAPYEAPSP